MFEINLQAKNGLNSGILASRDELNRACDQVVISESQRGYAICLCGLDKFRGRGKSLLQGVCGVTGEVKGQGVEVGSGSIGRLGHIA